MESETFRSRVLAVLQKGRRALRLYSSGSSSRVSTSQEFQSELSQLQVSEWREVNNNLVRKLSHAAESLNIRRVVFDIFAVRNELFSESNSAEAAMSNAQNELASSVENRDFARAAVLARSLVGLKARTQACQAAFHELDLVIRKSRVTVPTEEPEIKQTIELLEDQVVGGEGVNSFASNVEEQRGNVIPLRRRG